MKLGHQEIFEQMRRDILAGRLDGENKLPSEPCGGEYIIGAPQVPRVEIEVEKKVEVDSGRFSLLLQRGCRRRTST